MAPLNRTVDFKWDSSVACCAEKGEDKDSEMMAFGFSVSAIQAVDLFTAAT